MSRRIRVSVKPRARSDEVVAVGEGEYRVSVRAPAEDGKANEAVIALLADYFSLTKARIRIVRGHAARRKLVEIA